MSSKPHLTTRRGFLAAMGFSGISLYALWAGYRAAPGPWSLLGLGDTHVENGAGGHGSAYEGPTSEEFRRMTAEFVDRYRMPDGSVYPRRQEGGARETDHDMHSDASGAMHPAASPPAPAGSHGGVHGGGMEVAHGVPREPDHPVGGGHDAATDHAAGDGAIDVYMLAEKWSYEPSWLRLDAGKSYRFRMMAADVSHGASIQFGRGGRMVRLRPDSVAEQEMSFRRPGRYLVYCTVYCGAGHDLMQARIDVV